MSEFAPDAELTLEIDETGSGSVANNLTTTVEGYVLDARQGRVLDQKKLDKANVANNLTTTVEGYALDARQGRQLEQTKIGINQIANDLSTNDSNKVLSAVQGKALGDKIVVLENALDNLLNLINTNATAINEKASMKTATATLPASRWSQGDSYSPIKQYISVPNVPAAGDDNAVLVVAAPGSYVKYHACGVRCTDQGNWTLGFECTTIPGEDLTVNVLILT